MTEKKYSSILRVAIPTPLRKTFDYLSLDAPCKIGVRVKVSFGRRIVVGVVVRLVDHSEVPLDKLKSVIEVIDEAPLLDEKLLTLCQWASDYYHHPIGEVVVGVLPKKAKVGARGQASGIAKDTELSALKESGPSYVLTDEQQKAINAIMQAKHFQPFLLSGVTGSGKTEVYLQVIAETIKQKKQALVLVPEISLTPQTVSRFSARFNVPILLLHSGLTDLKRFQSWMTVTEDKPCVVIGTRSAVFAPLKNLGVIIVDEEHDISFKQQTGFRYSARDVAVMRAKIAEIPIVLGSATPSLETWRNIEEKKYQLLTLSQRAGDAALPIITTHNIRSKKLQNGLSEKLIETMRRHLNNHNQILLYLNRRGYAPVLLCHQCGWSAKCPHCDARLTVHDRPKKLLCHHCGYQTLWVRICSECKQGELLLLGLGTEQLEDHIKNIFPDKKIARIDRDSIKNFKTLESVLSQIHNNEVDILIGTQMLVKGHHFENVTLVAALDVDHALFSSDFRAVERLGQSLIQVAGRAGRAEKTGEVFVQTHYPDHPLLNEALSKNYSAFSNALLKDRSLMRLPPYSFMAILRAEAKNQERVELFLSHAKKILSQQKSSVEISDPLPVAMTKKAGVYRMQLLLQSSNRTVLQQILSLFMTSQEKQKKISGLRWMMDVDPMEMG